MMSYSREARLLATGAAALAGFVDAVAFIQIGGFFVSFMSGNTTRLAVGLAERSSAAATAGALIATFVLGVMLGSLIGRFAGPYRQPAVLAGVAALLAVAAALSVSGAIHPAAFAMAIAMGAENAVFQTDGEVRIGLTYMTGTLVKLGQRLAVAMLGGERFGWVPYLLLWLGLATGGFLGALTSAWIGASALWIAAGVAAILATVAALRRADG